MHQMLTNFHIQEVRNCIGYNHTKDNFNSPMLHLSSDFSHCLSSSLALAAARYPTIQHVQWGKCRAALIESSNKKAASSFNEDTIYTTSVHQWVKSAVLLWVKINARSLFFSSALPQKCCTVTLKYTGNDQRAKQIKQSVGCKFLSLSTLACRPENVSGSLYRRFVRLIVFILFLYCFVCPINFLYRWYLLEES